LGPSVGIVPLGATGFVIEGFEIEGLVALGDVVDGLEPVPVEPVEPVELLELPEL
jgi:hypothetical protein